MMAGWRKLGNGDWTEIEICRSGVQLWRHRTSAAKWRLGEVRKCVRNVCSACLPPLNTLSTSSCGNDDAQSPHQGMNTITHENEVIRLERVA